jgi:hypothetical protein
MHCRIKSSFFAFLCRERELAFAGGLADRLKDQIGGRSRPFSQLRHVILGGVLQFAKCSIENRHVLKRLCKSLIGFSPRGIFYTVSGICFLFYLGKHIPEAVIVSFNMFAQAVKDSI